MGLTVNDRARAIATFRFIEVRLMEILAGWTPTTPEMEVKVMFGRHIWDFAQHADWLGKRTFELRQPEHYTLAPVDSYLELLTRTSSIEETSGRLASVYDALLPGLDLRYREYLQNTDRLLDEPSVAIIERIVRDLERLRNDAYQLRRYLKLKAWPVEELRRSELSHQSIVAEAR